MRGARPFKELMCSLPPGILTGVAAEQAFGCRSAGGLMRRSEARALEEPITRREPRNHGKAGASKMEKHLADIRDGLRILHGAPIEQGDLPAQQHRYLLNPPLSEEEVARFEDEHRIALPSDFRAFVTRLGNGGAGPGYGVFKLGEWVLFWDSEPWKENEGLIGRHRRRAAVLARRNRT
jgi:hypothetical protein